MLVEVVVLAMLLKVLLVELVDLVVEEMDLMEQPKVVIMVLLL